MLNLFNRIKPGNFFVFAALLFGMLFNLVTPPLQAPDELNHFYRAYQIAEGHFLPERTSNRLGGQIPVCFNEFVTPYNFAATNLKYTFDRKDVLNDFDIKFNGEKKEFRDFPSTTTYSAISYLPQVIGLFIVKQFDCSMATLYYAGRLFSFIFWLLIMYIVINLLPVYKWLFTLLILLPMNLYVANAYSADGVNNCLTFLLIALVLKHIFSESKITTKDIFILLLIITLLSLAKFVYISFILLLLLIPKEKFKSQFYRFAGIGIILISSLCVFFLWSRVYMANYIKIADYDQQYKYNIGLSPCADHVAQKEYIFNHPTYFFKVIYHSIFDHPQTFLKGYIGAFGQADIPLPDWIYILMYTCIILLAATEVNKFAITIFQKFIFFCAAFCAFVLILLSIHLMWDCVGEGVVDLVQGRYLIPIFPLLFILFYNKKFQLKIAPVLLILPLMMLIYIFSVKYIYNRFFSESFFSKTEFYCDAESNKADVFFSTTDQNISLEGAGSQTNLDQRSGKFSILLSPESPYGFSYKFKDLKEGDLIEMEVWKKGEGGFLAVSAKGEACKDLFIADKNIVLTDKNGWSKIHRVITITEKCDFSEAVFFAWNPGKTNVYFDDIKFSIKKFPHN